ncbi:MAG: carbon-nitrogen hydrolase family protein [Armatimonadetes bacterium]|nr:carbon-nitrogen hydrolase family protein [Armatimonadota bacterium]
MRVAIIQAPNGLLPGSEEWRVLAQQIRDEKPEVLITNEMPFGPWLAESNTYEAALAAKSIALHEEGLVALRALQIPVVLSSRPVPAGDRLANEAFALAGGEYIFGHHKHYFPAEPGFFETEWFQAGKPGFHSVEAGALRAGFLLCTELFFNEWAREYRRQDANLIAVPRASGESVEKWLPAAKMAAIVSGCHVASSNRVGRVSDDLTFGGRGFCIAPDGSLIGETSPQQPVFVFDLDPAVSKRQQQEYPCYVKELSI